MDEIEERYYAEMQNAENEFLEKIKTSKNFRKIEEEYQIKIDSIHSKFEANSRKFFKSKKFLESQKKKTKTEGNKIHFEVKSLDMKMSFSERLKIWFMIKKFNFSRKIRNILDKIIPKKIVFWKFKIKRITKDTINDSSRKAGQIEDDLSKSAKDSKSKIGKLSSKIFSPIKNFFKKKEKKENKDEEVKKEEPEKTENPNETESPNDEEKVKNN